MRETERQQFCLNSRVLTAIGFTHFVTLCTRQVTGGRNGYGAKLTNIYSLKFIVETANKDTKKTYKQVFTDNMGTIGKPSIQTKECDDFTKITFYPDLARFGLSELTDDTVAFMTRRAYDMAGKQFSEVSHKLKNTRVHWNHSLKQTVSHA